MNETYVVSDVLIRETLARLRILGIHHDIQQIFLVSWVASAFIDDCGMLTKRGDDRQKVRLMPTLVCEVRHGLHVLFVFRCGAHHHGVEKARSVRAQTTLDEEVHHGLYEWVARFLHEERLASSRGPIHLKVRTR